MPNTAPDLATAHSLGLRAAASKLTLMENAAASSAPVEALHNIAAALEALRRPVAALAGSNAADTVLAEAAAAVHELMILKSR